MYSNKLICDILVYINDNINSKISVDDLQKKYFYNRYYIMKLFKKEIGLTLIDYINYIRVYNALCDIRYTKNKLLNIAFKNGFYSLEYFSETFKRVVGESPMIALNYFRRKKDINQKCIDKINESLIKLYGIYNLKDKYIKNQRPDINPVKKLSIFK